MSPWVKILNPIWVRLWSQWWVHPPVLPFSSHFSTQNPDMLFWWHFAVISVLLVSPFQHLVVPRSFAECSWSASQLHCQGLSRRRDCNFQDSSTLFMFSKIRTAFSSVCLCLFLSHSLSLCLSCTSFIFSDPSKITNSSSLSQPQVSLWVWDVFILMQSSTHFQPALYLTSEPPMWDPSPTVSPLPLLLRASKYKVDVPFPLGQ